MEIPTPCLTQFLGKFHITGGWVEDLDGESNDVLAWEPVTESWELVGHLINARYVVVLTNYLISTWQKN